MRNRFEGKTVFVSGAASGIGRAIATAFAGAGARLVISDVDSNGLREACAQIEKAGADCTSICCDLRDESAVADLAAKVRAQAGVLDILVNNAGIGYLGRFLDTSTEAWRRVLDVNVMGMVHVTRAFLPDMLAAGGERWIVNIASGAGFAPTPSMSAYAASKHAVVGLSEVLAMELQSTDVGVLIVAPGVINTAIVRARANISPSISDEQIERLQTYYSEHGCEPEVVADGVLSALGGAKPVLFVGPFARSTTTLMRLSRRLARRVTLRAARKLGYL